MVQSRAQFSHAKAGDVDVVDAVTSPQIRTGELSHVELSGFRSQAIVHVVVAFKVSLRHVAFLSKKEGGCYESESLCISSLFVLW